MQNTLNTDFIQDKCPVGPLVHWNPIGKNHKIQIGPTKTQSLSKKDWKFPKCKYTKCTLLVVRLHAKAKKWKMKLRTLHIHARLPRQLMRLSLSSSYSSFFFFFFFKHLIQWLNEQETFTTEPCKQFQKLPSQWYSLAPIHIPGSSASSTCQALHRLDWVAKNELRRNQISSKKLLK